MNKELEFLKIISETLDDNSYLGNDCAYLNKYNLTSTNDVLIEDVHFKTAYMSPYEIAQKAIKANISDILASASKIEYITIGLCGNFNNEFIKDFYRAVNDLSKQYNFKVIGGDLTKSDKIVVSITALGSYQSKNLPKRSDALPNYIVAVYGEFGTSAQGLYDLNNKINDNYFIQYHKNPSIYPLISEKIAKNIIKQYAMMDSSDGLIDCLYQISEKSSVKINIDYDMIPKKTKNRDFVLYGGEDYALVLCLDKNDYLKIPELIKIGEVLQGNGVYIDNKKIEYRSFKHFE